MSEELIESNAADSFHDVELAKEELRAGDVIAYYTTLFVAGDPRGYRESKGKKNVYTFGA
jgi:hypothetical protein